MSRAIAYLVDNHHISWLLMVITLCFGMLAIWNTDLTQDPLYNPPVLYATFYLDGAPPSALERDVVFPVETELHSVNDIDYVVSRVEHGYANIAIHFRYSIDVDQKIREVEASIDKIRRTLPEELDSLVRGTAISDAMSAFIIGVSDTANPGSSPVASDEVRYTTALALINELDQLPSLKNARIIEAEENIVVTLDLQRLREHRIDIDQIAAVVRADNAFASSGHLDVGEHRFRFDGPTSRYHSPRDILDSHVVTADGHAIALSALAQVEQRPRDRPVVSRYNHRNSLLVQVGVERDSNILRVQPEVLAAIARAQARAPESLQVELLFDQSDGVRRTVFNLLNSLLLGFVILVLVLLLSVGYRSALILACILPLSFCAAMALFSFTGFGIQQVSIGGFVIALGLIIDNAIVINESAYRQQKHHALDRRTAAIEGSAQSFTPLLSATLTTMLAFAPAFLLTSDIGLYIRSMSVSIWLSLAASLLLAMTVITALLARFGTQGSVGRLPDPPSLLAALVPLRDGGYRRLLELLMHRRALAVSGFLLLLAIATVLGSRLPLQIFPATGDPYFTINVDMPPGASHERLEALTRELEQRLSTHEDIEALLSLSGAEFPYLNVTIDYLGDIVILVRARYGDEERLRRLLAELDEQLAPLRVYADIRQSLFFYQDREHKAPITLVLEGNDAPLLQQFARRIDGTLRTVEGIASVRNPMRSGTPALQALYREDRARSLGITRDQVNQATALLTYGREIARFRDGRGREFPLLLKVDAERDEPFDIFRRVMLRSASGNLVPLSEVVEPVLGESESHITHVQFQPVVEIDLWPQEEGLAPEAAAHRVLAAVANAGIPDGIVVRMGGALEAKAQDFGQLGRYALVTALLIFSIFVLQFKSFAQPLIVFSAVPFCIIGALPALYLTGLPINFFAAVGMISLMGIVVNDSILLVDEGNHLRRTEPTLNARAIAIEAGRRRFMPVVLTSLTTIAGVLPLAMGSNVFKAMAVTLIGGLVSATAMILLLVPVMYSLLSVTATPAGTEDSE